MKYDYELWVGKGVRETVMACFKVLSQYLLGRPKENHKKPTSA
jgi:hypothetical protein